MTANLLEQLQQNLVRDLGAFLPELLLCAAIVIMLLLRVLRVFERENMGWLALLFTAGALVVAGYQWYIFDDYLPGWGGPRAPHNMDLFGGMLIFDRFSIFIKLFLLLFTGLVMLLGMMTRIPDREDSADFCCLLLGATIGMSIMASANHLLMVFMGVEMASVPSYALAGYLKGRRESSEAALKYVVYGGGAAGVMLYGISLIAGRFGTGYLPDVMFYLSTSSLDPLLVLGILFILVGIAFKLAAVPFHFWCPDVFEGAAAEVAAFLSVASKGAALALLARFVLGMGEINPTPRLGEVGSLARLMVFVLAAAAAVTTTFGNLAAYAQTNLKRLLAYSTIAHAGFMMMGLATMDRAGAGAVLFYLAIYLVMNLGAFAVVAFLRNLTGSEELSSFRGLVQRSPVMVITLAVFLLSLLGLPPLAGFAAKFQIFQVLYQSADRHANDPAVAATLYALLVIGGLNTVLSLFYYVKVIKVMTLERPLEDVEGRPVAPLEPPVAQSGYATVLALIILALGIFWNPLSQATREQGVLTFEPTARAKAAPAGIPPAPPNAARADAEDAQDAAADDAQDEDAQEQRQGDR
jgi:NADH-quinone oxidoreductase subunit N